MGAASRQCHDGGMSTAIPSTLPPPLSTPTAPATEAGLTATELAHFQTHGWVVRRQLVDVPKMVAITREIDGLHEAMAACADSDGRTPHGAQVAWEEHLPIERRRIRQLMNSERVSPLLDAVSRSAAMLAILRQLVGPEILLFHSKLMMKAARDGSFTPWHQDFQYWQYEAQQPSQVNAMLFIDAADAANGALRFVDGSHRLGLLPPKRFASSSFSIGLDGDLDAYPEATLVDMTPGDVVFFGPLVIHGSGPNASDRDRRANTFAFDRPGNRLKGELPITSWRLGPQAE